MGIIERISLANRKIQKKYTNPQEHGQSLSLFRG